MWVEFDVQVPEHLRHRLYGDRGSQHFHRHVAALTEKYGLNIPSKVFGYVENAVTGAREAGPGFNPYVFGVTRNGLRMAAVGKESVAEMRVVAGLVHSMLMRECGTFLPMHDRSGEHSASFFPAPRPYFLKSMRVGLRQSRNYWVRQANRVLNENADWVDIAGDRIAMAIAYGFFLQAEYMVEQEDDEIEGDIGGWLYHRWAEDSREFDKVKAFKEHLDIRVLDVANTFFDTSKRHTLVVLGGVEFSMKAAFSLGWSTGRVRSEGRGQLIASRMRSLSEFKEKEAA